MGREAVGVMRPPFPVLAGSQLSQRAGPSPPCWPLGPQQLPQRPACIPAATVSSIFLSRSVLFSAFDPAHAGGLAFVSQLVGNWEHVGFAPRWEVEGSSGRAPTRSLRSSEQNSSEAEDLSASLGAFRDEA